MTPTPVAQDFLYHITVTGEPQGEEVETAQVQHPMRSKLWRRYLSTARLLAMRHFGALYLRWLEPGIYRSYRRLLDSGVSEKMAIQSNRALDLRILLHHHRPRHIVELGSGLSTVLFADYCARRGARLISFEEDQKWVRQVVAALPEALRAKHGPSLKNRVLTAAECRYDAPIPHGADFIYVDGPAGSNDGGIRRACTDIVRALKRGERPKVICIDGRNAIVDAVRDTLSELQREDASTRYVWRFGCKYAEYLGEPAPGRIGPHTVAVRAD